MMHSILPPSSRRLSWKGALSHNEARLGLGDQRVACMLDDAGRELLKAIAEEFVHVELDSVVVTTYVLDVVVMPRKEYEGAIHRAFSDGVHSATTGARVPPPLA